MSLLGQGDEEAGMPSPLSLSPLEAEKSEALEEVEIIRWKEPGPRITTWRKAVCWLAVLEL